MPVPFEFLYGGPAAFSNRLGAVFSRGLEAAVDQVFQELLVDEGVELLVFEEVPEADVVQVPVVVTVLLQLNHYLKAVYVQ